jgi:peptide deformylase
MILPIYGYGESVLRNVCEDISLEYPNLKETIANMYDTMYHAHGVGLAAPQVGLPIRLFIVDTEPFSDNDDVSKEEATLMKDFKKTFINAKIVKEEGDIWGFNEGCLSIPTIREDIERKPVIRMKYQDEDFNYFEETFEGILARVIQHEYDHIEGVLFTDRLSQLRRTLLRGKLQDVSKGKVKIDYKMKFPQIRRK